MSPLVPILVLAGGLYAIVELYYRLEHKRGVKESARRVDVPEEWLNTLWQIRGLPDGKRSLVYDWGIDDWTEDK